MDGSYPIIATSYLTSTFLPELIDGFGEHFLKASQNHCRMVSPSTHAPPFALRNLNGATLTATL
jgi:hypothetical protein